MRDVRTCDACYGAKKKCDETSASPPKCARCTRLNIPCAGRGQRRFQFKAYSVIVPPREVAQNRSGARASRQPPASSPDGLEIVAISPPQTVGSSPNSDSGQQAIPDHFNKALASRFSATLKINDPTFDLSVLAGWLTHIPERLGADDLLDKAALAFLNAFDYLKGVFQATTASTAYEVAMTALDSALQDQVKSSHLLAAVFMLNMAQIWTFNSAEHYMNHIACTCQLLNDTVEEDWSDSIAHSVRVSLIEIVCIESIINPSLKIDSRYLHSLKYESGPYLPLDEENGQAIETLELPFLLRLSRLLREPEKHHEEIKRSYVRLKTEWPFTRRRYRTLAGISKIAGIKSSGLVQPGAQLAIAHLTILGISLVLNACLTSMDPMNVNLQQDALENAREAVQLSRKLLQELPKGVWFTPVALFASWIATDDPGVTCNAFSTVKKYSCYWADPAYIEQAMTLKEQYLQLRVKTTNDQNSVAIQHFGLRGGYGTCSVHPQGNQGQGGFPLLSPQSGSQFFGMDPRGGAFSELLPLASDGHPWSPTM